MEKKCFLIPRCFQRSNIRETLLTRRVSQIFSL
jgi:hypothetical protein